MLAPAPSAFLDGSRALDALTSAAGTLRELVETMSDLPAYLSALTGLEVLQVECLLGVWMGAVHLESALPQLQRLTCLDLAGLSRMHASYAGRGPALPQLAGLRLCDMGGQLPGGSWLSSLRSLELYCCSLGAAWLDMHQLERVRLFYLGGEEEEEPMLQALCGAPELKSLRHLRLVTNEPIPREASQTLVGMQRRSPQLLIEFKGPHI